MAHDPRHPDVDYDPNELIRLGDVIDLLHMHDNREGSVEHPADTLLRLIAGRNLFGKAQGARYGS